MTIWLSLPLVVAMGTGLLLAGFATGRWVGRRQGERLGLNRAPLDLRVRALEAGCCPVCGADSPAEGDPYTREKPPGTSPGSA